MTNNVNMHFGAVNENVSFIGMCSNIAWQTRGEKDWGSLSYNPQCLGMTGTLVRTLWFYVADIRSFDLG